MSAFAKPPVLVTTDCDKEISADSSVTTASYNCFSLAIVGIGFGGSTASFSCDKAIAHNCTVGTSEGAIPAPIHT